MRACNQKPILNVAGCNALESTTEIMTTEATSNVLFYFYFISSFVFHCFYLGKTENPAESASTTQLKVNTLPPTFSTTVNFMIHFEKMKNKFEYFFFFKKKDKRSWFTLWKLFDLFSMY